MDNTQKVVECFKCENVEVEENRRRTSLVFGSKNSRIELVKKYLGESALENTTVNLEYLEVKHNDGTTYLYFEKK